MSTKIRRIVIYIFILGLSIGIIWWLSEMYKFAKGVKDDQIVKIDTVVYNLDSIRHANKINRIDSGTNISSKKSIASNNKVLKTDGKLDLDSLIHIHNNQYLLSLSGGEVQLCYGYRFDLHVKDYNIFTKRTEKYNNGKSDQVVTVYIFENSFLKEYFNKDPDVNRLDIVYGRILSDKISLTEGVRVGMSKNAMLLKIFKPSDLFDSINKLTIYEDERGEYWTSIIFKDNRLAEVIFDSDYDWIDKKLKR